MKKGTKLKVFSIDAPVKTKDVDGERRIVFVASSSQEDRHGETVAVDTLRLPLKGGGFVVVGSVPEAGVENVDIPFMIDHSWSVEDRIGSVRKAWYANGELIFECGLATTEIAQTITTLADEGHVGNSFSISMRDFDYNAESGLISNAEIVEVSMVFRGANNEARLLAIKSLKGEKMTKKELAERKARLQKELAAIEEAEDVPADDTNEQPSGDAATPPESDEADEPKSEEDAPADPAPEDDADDNNTNSEEEKENMKKKLNHQIAADEVKDKAELPTQPLHASEDYLKSKEALVDYFKILKSFKGDATGAHGAWQAKVAEKGISGDSILPTQVAQAFIDVFENPTGFLNKITFLPIKSYVINALTGTGEDIRAKGHTKGQTKQEQKLANKRRALLCRMIYKKLSLDQIDIWNAPELLPIRTAELAKQLYNEIERAVVTGDGRVAPSSGDPDLRVFVDTEGIYSVKGDVQATGTDFGTLVASEYTPVDTDENLYDSVVSAASKLKAQGPVVLFAKSAKVTDLRKAKGAAGNYILAPGANAADIFGVDAVYTPEWMDEDEDYDAYLIVAPAYEMIGELNPMEKADYDSTKNQDVLVLEVPRSGSLAKYKAAVGIEAKDYAPTSLGVVITAPVDANIVNTPTDPVNTKEVSS
jgi:hypothetical protein